METMLDEVADDVFRLSTFVPDANIMFNQFIVRADAPLLFHTGPRALFPLVAEAIGRVVPLDQLRWLTFGHVEADECGAMNQLLDAAPHATVAHGAIACMVQVNDLADREPRPLDDGEVLDLGGRRVRSLDTPHIPHGWDAHVLYEEVTHTLFCGDLGSRFGESAATTTDDIVEAALAVLILVYGCRTWMRNPEWTSELTLAAADVRTAPGSFRIHEMLAHALSEENGKANIDEAIRQQEMAWRILRPVPAKLGYQQAPANLGGYYIAKGDMLGGAATSEGRAWYEKAVAVLSEGEAMSRVVEQHYDEAQRAHGKPLENRAAMPNLYLNLGAAYAELGRSADAIQAFRYGRNVEPKSAEVYDGLAGAYLAEGKAEWAAISIVEKAQVDGAQAATLSALRTIYLRIPEGACGVTEGGGALKLNLECARMRSDLCTAWVDLAQAFAEARQAAASVEFTQRAAAFGCR